MPTYSTPNIRAKLALEQDISEKDQPNGYAGLDSNGDIVGPIILNETSGPDVPEENEVVARTDRRLALGDGITTNGVLVEGKSTESIKLFKPSDGAVMSTRKASGNFSVTCQTSSGQYAVDWWDGTRTLHNSNVAATKACANNAMKLVKVYPATTGQSLTVIDCSSQTLVSLDVSDLSDLIVLYCAGNLLTTLDVSGLTSLAEISCASNLLTSLDVSGLTALTDINCAGNQIANLDVSGLESLTYLSCSGNNMTILVVSGLIALTWLDCQTNSLTSLDISGLTALTALICRNNSLTNLRAIDCVLTYSHSSGYGSTVENNNLDAAALDQFYTDLGVDVGATGIIWVNDNPGTTDDHPEIATAKGYTIIGS